MTAHFRLALALIIASPVGHPRRHDPKLHQTSVAAAYGVSIDTIAGIPPGRSMRWPSMVALADTIYLAANTFPTDGSAPIGARPLVMTRLPGGPMPLPTGDFAFAYPKVVARPSGGVDLFWVEFANPTPTAREWGGLPSSIWHAQFEHGTWSTPEALLRAHSVLWSGDNGQIAVDKDHKVHIAVPVSLTLGVPRLMQIVGSTGRWTTSGAGIIANHTSILSAGADSLVVAIAAPDPSVPGNHGSVFTTRSGDGGLRWSIPTLVASSGDTTAFAPRVVRTGHGLDVVSASSRGNMILDRIERAHSSDGGKTWQRFSGRPLPAGSIEFDALGMPCGDIEIVVETFDGTRLQARRLTWSVDGSVVEDDPFANDYLAGSLGLVAIGPRLRLAGAVLETPSSAARAVLVDIASCPGH